MILTCLTLLGYCLFLCRYTRWPMEAIPFCVISIAIVSLYVFTYLGMLQIGSYAFLGVGGLLLTFSPLYLPKKLELIFSKYFTPGLCCFIFYLIAFGILTKHAVVVGSDDYGKWMDLAKYLYFRHDFLYGYVISHTEYPPGGSLLCYLFLKLGDYSEAKLFFAQLCLILSPVVILFNNNGWNHWFRTFSISFAIILALIICFEVPMGFVTTLMMDNPVGLFFGGILASYFLLNKNQHRSLYLSLPIMAMCLFRPMMSPFILSIAIIIFSNELFFNKEDKKLLRLLSLFAAIVVMPSLILISWHHHINIINSKEAWNLPNFKIALLNKFFTVDAQHVYHSIKIFAIACLKLMWIPALFFLLISMCLLQKTISKFEKKRLLFNHTLLLLGLVAYGIFSLLFFLYFFQPMDDNIIEISYHRFLLIYLLGWFLVIVANLIQLSPLAIVNYSAKLSLAWQRFPIKLFILDKPFSYYLTKSPFKFQHLIAIIVILSFHIHLANQYQHHYRRFYHDKVGWEYVRNVTAKNFAVTINQILHKDAKIGILRDATNPLLSLVFLPSVCYELIPRYTYVFYSPYLPMQTLAPELKDLDYILLMNVNNEFWKQHKNYFTKDEIHRKKAAFCSDEAINAYQCDVPITLYKIARKGDTFKFIKMFETTVVL